MAMVAIVMMMAVVGITAGVMRFRVMQRKARDERRRQRRAVADAQWQAMMAGRGEERHRTA